MGLALVESLARLLLCNRFWLAREESAGRPLGIEELDVVKARRGWVGSLRGVGGGVTALLLYFARERAALPCTPALFNSNEMRPAAAYAPPHTHTPTHQQALVELLLLNFDPSTEAASRMRQALPVFFESYAHQHERHHMYLATALLPAARRAAAEDAASGRRVTAASASAPTVMRFVATLLQVPVAQADGQVGVGGAGPLLPGLACTADALPAPGADVALNAGLT